MQHSFENKMSEDPPLDFTEHLQRTLGVDHDTASKTLADWLTHYQPARRPPIEILQST